MPDPKMVSEREAVARERKAYERGAVGHSLVNVATIRERAREVYPLPRVERPRVVKDDAGFEFKLSGSTVMYRPAGNNAWWTYAEGDHMRSRAAALADLFANPTELVEEDA